MKILLILKQFLHILKVAPLIIAYFETPIAYFETPRRPVKLLGKVMLLRKVSLSITIPKQVVLVV